jgi:hypothetical protein
MYAGERLGTRKCDNLLSRMDIFSPGTSQEIPLWTYGVQGVASSNPAVPTNEINGLAAMSC